MPLQRELAPSLVAVKAALGFEAEEAKTKELDDLAVRFAGGASRAGTAASSASGAEVAAVASAGAASAWQAGGGGGGGASAVASEATLAALLREIATLRTGEDAIGFFLRNGADSCPIKFLYLVRALPLDSREGFAPYRLCVVTEAQALRNGEHLVMSSRGLMLCTPGRPSEFQSTMDFLREGSCFSAISSLGFFRHYLPRKMFNQWRASVRFNRFARARAATAAALFAWSPTFAPALAEVAAQLTAASQQPVFIVKMGERFQTPTALHETQSAARMEAFKRWEANVRACVAAVERCVADVVARAHPAYEGEEGGSGGGGGGGGGGSSASYAPVAEAQASSSAVPSFMGSSSSSSEPQYAPPPL
jgi:hypothetical protein